MSTIITLASPKGGVGKSTLVIMMAGELAQQGRSVAVIDADPQKTVVNWWERSRENGRVPDNLTVEECPNEAMLGALIAKHDDRDAILIDLQGVSSRLAVRAAAASDIVLIPSKLGLANAEQNLKIVAAIREMAAQANIPVPLFRIVLNDVSHLQRGMKQFMRTLQAYADDDMKALGHINDWRPTYVEVIDDGGTLYHQPQSKPGVQAAILNIQSILADAVAAIEEPVE